MPTPTVENYLKQILMVTLDENCAKVPMGKVASELSVTPGTATSMVKKMESMQVLLLKTRWLDIIVELVHLTSLLYIHLL